MAKQEAARRHRLGEATQGPLQSGAASQSPAERCQERLVLERRRLG